MCFSLDRAILYFTFPPPQHVLNGCIMDMVMGPGEGGGGQEDGGPGGAKRSPRPQGGPVKKVMKVTEGSGQCCHITRINAG